MDGPRRLVTGCDDDMRLSLNTGSLQPGHWRPAPAKTGLPLAAANGRGLPCGAVSPRVGLSGLTAVEGYREVSDAGDH